MAMTITAARYLKEIYKNRLLVGSTITDASNTRDAYSVFHGCNIGDFDPETD
jgi:hypothetical protein